MKEKKRFEAPTMEVFEFGETEQVTASIALPVDFFDEADIEDLLS